jgi:hypothetical protein
MQVRKLSRLSLVDRRGSAPRPRAPALSTAKQAPCRSFARDARRRRDGTRAAGREPPESVAMTINTDTPRPGVALSRRALNHTRSDGGLMGEHADTFPHATGAIGAAGARARPWRPRRRYGRDRAGRRRPARRRARGGREGRRDCGGRRVPGAAARATAPRSACDSGDAGLGDVSRAAPVTGHSRARPRVPPSCCRDPGHDRCLMGQIVVLSIFAAVHRSRCLGRTFYPVQRLHHTTEGNYPQPGARNTPG